MRMKWIGEKIENMAAHYSMARLAENGRKIIINSFCNSLQIYTSKNPSAREYGNLENKYANCIEEDKEGSRRHRRSDVESPGVEEPPGKKIECKLISCLIKYYILVSAVENWHRSLPAPLQRPLLDSMNIIMQSTQKCRAFWWKCATEILDHRMGAARCARQPDVFIFKLHFQLLRNFFNLVS